MAQLVHTSFEAATCLADPGIPTLQGVLDPNELGEHLQSVLPASWGSLRDVQIQVLRHHCGSRCVVAIQIRTTEGMHELIGKVHAKDRSDVYRAMKHFSESGFGPECEFSIPQPLVFLPKLGLLLQEKISGLSATEVLETCDEGERARAVEQCARWLARFQALAPQLGTFFVATDALVDGWRRRFKESGPLAEKAELLSQRVKAVGSALDGTAVCACHGSYSHRQIIFTKSRAVAFDWDNYCVANPARDVATFIVKLQQLALKLYGSRRVFDSDIELFYETYKATSKFAIAKQLPFYKAVHCFKHANPNSRAPEKTEALLDEGLRILNEET